MFWGCRDRFNGLVIVVEWGNLGADRELIGVERKLFV